MSTTVTYKGDTIATVENNTKTLTTQGKYLEDNITLTDVSGSGATDFVVTLSWDSTEQMWMPDKTLSEIYDAFSDGLNIVVVSGVTSGTVRVYGEYEQHYNALSYFVDVLNGNEITEIEYAYDPNGVREVDRVVRILPNFESPSVTYTPTESQQTDTITPSQGYNGIDEVDITVGAISPTYVGSEITRRSSTDLSASGATVTVPAGYYSSQASKSVTSGTAGTPTATKGAVSNHSVSVTPSVTNTTGYITGSTKTGTAVSVSASELVSGSETKTANGTYDVTNLAELVVNVSGGGGTSKNVQVLQSTSRTNSSSLTKVLGDLTVSKTGTYDVYWSGGRSNTSSSYTWGTRLYVDGSGYGTENTSWTNNCQSNHLTNVSLTQNQKLSVYSRGRSGSYYTFAPMLVIVEA